MRIIKTQQDIDMLYRFGAVLVQVEGYFLQLRDEQENKDGNGFCLGRHDYIVVLEAGDKASIWS